MAALNSEEITFLQLLAVAVRVIRKGEGGLEKQLHLAFSGPVDYCVAGYGASEFSLTRIPRV